MNTGNKKWTSSFEELELYNNKTRYKNITSILFVVIF